MLSSATRENAKLAQLPGLLIGDADEVADEGYRACMEGAVVSVPGRVNRAVTLASRATPKWLLRRIAGALMRKGAQGHR
jgi:short-subunit dehydrogenase